MSVRVPQNSPDRMSVYVYIYIFTCHIQYKYIYLYAIVGITRSKVFVRSLCGLLKQLNSCGCSSCPRLIFTWVIQFHGANAGSCHGALHKATLWSIWKHSYSYLPLRKTTTTKMARNPEWTWLPGCRFQGCLKRRHFIHGDFFWWELSKYIQGGVPKFC